VGSSDSAGDAFRLGHAVTLCIVNAHATKHRDDFFVFGKLSNCLLARQEIGLCWGDLKSHSWALAYPVLVLGLSAAIAWFFGAVDTIEASWKNVLLNISAGSTIGILMVLITEEGFFRGWLWASLKRSGQSELQVLCWTSFIFVLWRVSAVSLDTGFDITLK